MQLQLTESVKPIQKYDRDIQSKLLPALLKMGYKVDQGRTLKEKFVNTYFGTYTDRNGNSMPFTLELNTAHPKNNKQLYTTLSLGSDKFPLGSIKSNDPNTLMDFIDNAIKDPTVYTNKYNSIPTEEEPTEEEKQDEESIKALAGAKAGILNKPKEQEVKQEELAEQKEKEPEQKVDTDLVGKKIQEILKNYGISSTYESATVGPAVTQYEFKLAPGTKISELSGLSKEIAMGLAVKQVSIAPVEGKTTIGIQVPNAQIKAVSLDEVLEKSEKKGVSVALGKDLNGNAVNADILDMQHVLIGGSTGSGKSASINSMITSLIQSYPPDLVKLVLIDPKKVELKAYEGLPHLAQDIITDPHQADAALKKLCETMDKRYETFSKVGVRNIKAYNNLVDDYNNEHPDKPQKYMPYIVIIIDELADLMMTAGKSVEASIQRIAQLARAAGIHMIVATQRPSADIVTGPIKTNIQSRIAFATPSNVDSRVILDQGGAEKLLGKGDMLFKPTGESSPKRIQGAYVSDQQIEDIVNKVKEQYK